MTTFLESVSESIGHGLKSGPTQEFSRNNKPVFGWVETLTMDDRERFKGASKLLHTATKLQQDDVIIGPGGECFLVQSVETYDYGTYGAYIRVRD